MNSLQMSTTASPWVAIIDDEKLVAETMATAAAQLGCRVNTMTSVEELLEGDHLSYDVIVLDLNMPKVDGIQCLRRLAQRGCGARIILTSGYDSRVLETAVQYGQGLELDMLGAIEKPFRISVLRNLLSIEDEAKKKAVEREYPVSLDDVLRAMDEGEFEMHYQPLVSLATGQLSGLEALIRWENPELGMVPPNAFLPIVEEHNLSLPLFKYVTDRVLSGCSVLKHYLPVCTQLAINLPPSALSESEFPDQIVALAGKMGCPADRIKFELTETSVFENFSKAYEIISRLRLKGYGVSMDDFGTGYSSLAQFSKLPFSQVKIDMHFIQTAMTCAASRAIVENTVKMAKQLEINVVAEGVEDYETYDWLREIGCDEAQGWFIAKAMPPRALLLWLNELANRSDLKPPENFSDFNRQRT